MFSARSIAARYRSDPTVRGLCQNVVAVAGPARRDRPDPAADRAHRARRAGPHGPRRAGGRAAVGRPVPAGGPRRGRDDRGAPPAAGAVRPVRHPAVDLAGPAGRRRPGRARRRSWWTAAGCASSSRCCTRSSPSAATCSRPGPRCWRWTPCCAPATAAPAGARWPGRSTGSSSGAHEFTELRLLGALRSGAVTLPARDADDGERLLGDAGASAAARLGLAPDAPAPELTEAAYAALERWQRHTVNPMLGRATADACRAVVRSCEGILAGLA